MINPCCCEVDCSNVFNDSFSDGDLDPDWVNPENLTYNGDGTATLAANTVVSITPTLVNGSGSLVVDFKLAAAGDFLIIRFAKKDANNYWWVKFTRDADPYGGVPDGFFGEFWETIGGVDEYRGTRVSPGLIPFVLECDPDQTHHAVLCWAQGGRTYISGTCATMEWPNSITAGNSFEIEAGDTDVVLYHINLNPSYPTECPCNEYQCMTCNGELNDTMQIEIIGGPDDGLVLIADRYLDWPFFGTDCINFRISYWIFLTPCTFVAGDYFLQVMLCKGNGYSGTVPALRLIEVPAAPPAEYNPFTISDCEGPWDVELELDYPGGVGIVSVTFRITPL